MINKRNVLSIQERIDAFCKLGRYISDLLSAKVDDSDKEVFKRLIIKIEQENRWFTLDQVYFALNNWSDLLNKENIEDWVSAYNLGNKSLRIGVIQAGNLPLVGFHDFLSVLISGHIFVGKASSKDQVLPYFLSNLLIKIEPKFKDYVFWVDRIKDVDAIIATGSNNSARYFEYYFGDKPNIIRKNRSSWAILSGQETFDDLFLLGEDIFRYYGLGCRNISKLLVPEDYDFDVFFKAIESYNFVYNNNKYANNYDYNQSIYLLNQVAFLQNGFLILKEDSQFHSPLSVVFFEYYSSIEQAYKNVQLHQSEIQCVVDSNMVTDFSVGFGQTQKPKLNEYADQVDVLKWLSEL